MDCETNVPVPVVDDDPVGSTIDNYCDSPTRSDTPNSLPSKETYTIAIATSSDTNVRTPVVAPPFVSLDEAGVQLLVSLEQTKAQMITSYIMAEAKAAEALRNTAIQNAKYQTARRVALIVTGVQRALGMTSHILGLYASVQKQVYWVQERDCTTPTSIKPADIISARAALVTLFASPTETSVTLETAAEGQTMGDASNEWLQALTADEAATLRTYLKTWSDAVGVGGLHFHVSLCHRCVRTPVFWVGIRSASCSTVRVTVTRSTAESLTPSTWTVDTRVPPSSELWAANKTQMRAIWSRARILSTNGKETIHPM